MKKIIKRLFKTFVVLKKYDEGDLEVKKKSKKNKPLTYEEAVRGIKELKAFLMGKGEANENFGTVLKDGSLKSIIDSLEQVVYNTPLYGGVEEKAAALLIKIVKSHPFVDGNKRIGAFLAGLLLEKNGRPANKEVLILAAVLSASSSGQEEELIKIIASCLS